MSTKREARARRHRRVRKKIVGTAERPRLCVSRSNRHISAQIIDDAGGRTLVAASTLETDLRGPSAGTVNGAKGVGALIAERARQAGITTVVFDRGGNKFHGRVAAVAEAAREGGLEF